jgi:hypothetical protein
MNEYEAVEAAQALYANAATMFAIFLTITTSYLVVAYLVGAQLTSSQVFITTALFAVSSLITLASMAALFDTGIHYTALAVNMRGAEGIAPMVANRAFVAILVGVDALFVAAALKFMWDIRHPKSS